MEEDDVIEVYVDLRLATQGKREKNVVNVTSAENISGSFGNLDIDSIVEVSKRETSFTSTNVILRKVLRFYPHLTII